jgi:hypothetical protein
MKSFNILAVVFAAALISSYANAGNIYKRLSIIS